MEKLVMNVRSSLVTGIALLCICSCNGNLSRGDARRQISQSLQLPATQTTRISRVALNSATSARGGGFMPTITICRDLGTQWADVRGRIKALEEKGLVTLGQKVQKSGSCTYEYTTISLTPEGQRYLVSEGDDGYAVRTHTLVFGEVTGIRVIEQVKIAEAQYTLKTEDVTPFASDLSREPVARSATFQQFDDGWRIQ